VLSQFIQPFVKKEEKAKNVQDSIQVHIIFYSSFLEIIPPWTNFLSTFPEHYCKDESIFTSDYITLILLSLLIVKPLFQKTRP